MTNKSPTLQEYWAHVKKLQNESRQLRLGQIAFNVLVNCRPDLSEKIRATDLDPFYVYDALDSRWEAFVRFLRENWEPEEKSSETPKEEQQKEINPWLMRALRLALLHQIDLQTTQVYGGGHSKEWSPLCDADLVWGTQDHQVSLVMANGEEYLISVQKKDSK